MKFEWDPKKAEQNVNKHGISFEEASAVFGDPLAATVLDPRHSADENRFVTMGQSSTGQLVVVAHMDRGEQVRTISARLRRGAREGNMSRKKKVDADAEDMLPEYDFSGAARGKYYERYLHGSNVVLLDPDVSEAFPNATAVNETLRLLVSLARTNVPVKSKPRKGERPRAKRHRTSPRADVRRRR